MAAVQLSVVIVEYHCMEQIEGCLPTLREHLSGVQWECIILINSEYASDELERYRARLPDARLVVSDRNRGYAGGVNKAIPECNAPYIFVLNPDCRLVDANIPSLIDVLESNPRIAAVGPQVIFSNGEIQPSCRRFPRPWTFLLVRSVLKNIPSAGYEKRRYLMEDYDHKVGRDVDWLSGGAMLVRRTAIDAVGSMDERFFLYMEDVDWCKRFWKAGWRIHYCPNATVCHDAQHDSLKGGVKVFLSPHVRYHLASLAKYFLKYGLSK